ncbi:MAG: hypothetical protein Q8Q73_06155, partial [Stagnimonas sp.]|nr:hypothetical protein [Stagnimonas sp.]
MRLRPALFALSLALLSCRSAAAETPRIPLLQGTVYTLASSYPAGDEEHIATLSQLDDKLAVFAVESRAPVEGEAGKEQSARWERQVRRQDLVDGHRLNTVFQTGDPALFAGASFMHLSTAAFQELKDRGETALVLGTIKDFQGSGAKASMLMAVLSGRKYFRGTLKRVGSGTVDIPVLVNGERRLLPAIASVGELSVGADRIRVKYWWLDDAQDALMLRSDHRQLVRLDYPMPAPEKTLAASLSSGDCRATLPGIYFDTGSATLLAQSDTALQTVATLLKANPGWALTV